MPRHGQNLKFFIIICENPCLLGRIQYATVSEQSIRRPTIALGEIMLNHVVLIKFKKDVTKETIQELENLLEELPNKIFEIHSYEFGRNIIHSDRSYDFALISLFANIESLQRYQGHPDHQTVLKKMQSICESVFTVDFMGTDASDFKEKTPEQGIGTW